jgi:hypothetical protein
MKRGILIFWLVLVTGVLMLSSTYAMAQGGRIHSGDLKIIPGITIQGVYDDNIFLGNGDNTPFEEEESDWITHVMPSLLFDYSLAERGSIDFGYKGDFAYYNDNDENDWNRHEGIFQLNYDSPGGLILGVDNLFVDTEDPYSSENEFRIGQPQIERWYDRLNTTIGFDFSDQFKLFAYYNFYKQDYDEDIDFTQDFKYHEFGAGAQVRLHPKTWGFARYHYGEQDYYTHRGLVTDSNDSDFDWHRVNFGLTWDADAKVGGELNFGYQWKDYDNSIDAATPPNPYDDKNTLIAETLITYEASPTTALGLGLTRALREVGGSTNAYFEDTGISLNLQQVMVEKLTLNVGVVYSENDYNEPEPKEREDDNFKAKIDFNYQIQDWLSAQAGYQYWDKDSNYDSFEFTDNQLMISLSIVY